MTEYVWDCFKRFLGLLLTLVGIGILFGGLCCAVAGGLLLHNLLMAIVGFPIAFIGWLLMNLGGDLLTSL